MAGPMSDLRKIISKALRGPRPSPKHRWINTRAEMEWDDTRQRYVTVDSEGYWYDGPMALAMDTAPVWLAENYRWVNDDGTLTEDTTGGTAGQATYAAANNTAITVDVTGTTQYRLRTDLGETDGASGAGNEFTAAPYLQYAINGGTWTTVGAATDVRYFTSSNVTDNTTISKALHVLPYSSNETDQDGTFTANNSPAAMGQIWSNDMAEFEYTIDFAGTFSDGDTVTFRYIGPAGSALTFSNVPTANITVPTNSATGTPSVAKPTVTATTELIRKATGTPSVTKPTTTATTELIRPASGSPSVTKPTSTGVAELNPSTTWTSTGTPSVTKPTVTATTELIRTATGSPSVAKPTATGSSFLWPKVYLNTSETTVGATEMTVTAVSADGTSITFTDPAGAPTGSVFLGVVNQVNGDEAWTPVTVTVSAADETATGTAVITKPTATGVTELIRIASGSPSVTKPTTTGSAKSVYAASGAPQTTKPTTAGEATRIVTSTGTAQITKPTTAATTELIRKASGAPSVVKPTATGAATRILTSTGAPSVGKPTVTATTELIRVASGSPSVTKPTSTGTASKAGEKTASGSPSVTKPTATGAAFVVREASGSPQVTKPTVTAVTELIRPASGSPSVLKPTATGAATVIKTATGSPTVTKPTATGAAKIGYKASGSPQVQKPTANGSAQADVTGPSVIFTARGA